MMKAGITITKVWSDSDLIELAIKTSDGSSVFSTSVYVGHNSLEAIIASLGAFRTHVYGGLCDIQCGEFGPEYANGAFHARLHFHQPGNGKLFISVRAESDWKDFTVSKVANEATLYLTSEPALLDNFIEELRKINAGEATEAYFQSI